MSYLVAGLAAPPVFVGKQQPTTFKPSLSPERAVTTYVTSLQKFLRVPQTGIWDFPTHAALRTLMKENWAVEIGLWGGDPSKVARNAVVLVQPNSEAEFQRVKSLLWDFEFTGTTLDEYRAFIGSRTTTIRPLLDAVEEAIKQAERVPLPPGVGPQPPANLKVLEMLQAANIGLIAMGVVGIALVGWIVWRVRGIS